jgi:acyl-CoA synthetase (AMP-forming)/AMP-acid ligase II
MSFVSLSDRLAHLANTRGDHVALHHPRGNRVEDGWSTTTFAALDGAASAIATGLRQAGFQPGDRAALLLRPDAGFHALCFGLFRAGVVPVFLDPGMPRAMALRALAGLGPDALIAGPAVHALSHVVRAPFANVRRRVTAGTRWFWGGPTLADLAVTPVDRSTFAHRNPSDDAVLVFTSGSTGPAKAVALTEACMGARVDQIAGMIGLSPGERVVETLLVYTLLEVLMGMEVLIPPMDIAKPANLDPRVFAAAVRTFAPQTASASPVVWHRLAEHHDDPAFALPSLARMLTTAAPIPVALHQRLQRLVGPGVDLLTPYGATEAMPIACIGTREVLEATAEDTAAGAGICVGHPAPGADIRIATLNDGPIPGWSEAVVAEPGAWGEIVVSSAGASDAYRGDDAANARAKIRDGDRIWHRMGDVGRFDAEGRLWFGGRMSHRLRTPAGDLPNVPIEGVFLRHPAVRRAAVIPLGTPGEHTAHLIVELHPGHAWTPALGDEILRHAAGTRWEGLVVDVLPHPAFPTDTRHNSKVRNEDLAVWRAAQRR